ncbi:hypothetical protein C8F01DRAFT_1122026 [Mycena amicta]|nr:hypothetical protein C8F01DRAFT_1122026 [Mycena amicta]
MTTDSESDPPGLFVDAEQSNYIDFDVELAAREASCRAIHLCRRAEQDARTRVPYQARAKTKHTLHRVPRVVTEGDRSEDALAWTEEESFVSDARVPPSPAERLPEHCCPLCGSLFSHPVVNSACGHAYCYLCIRRHFQTSFHCPIAACNALTVRSEPMCVPAFETALAGLYTARYPNWVDLSETTYTFRGLTFPRREAISAWSGSVEYT